MYTVGASDSLPESIYSKWIRPIKLPEFIGQPIMTQNFEKFKFMHVKDVNKRKNANISKVFHENYLFFDRVLYLFTFYILFDHKRLFSVDFDFIEILPKNSSAKRRKSSTLSWVRIKTMTTSSGSVLI